MHAKRLAAPIGLALIVLLARSPVSLAQAPARAPAGATLFPSRGAWETRAPEAVGMDKTRLDEAVAFAIANENPATKDLALDLMLTFGGREPFDALVGPTAPRGSLNGLVIRAWLRRRRVRRHVARRHDVQRHEDVSLHRRGTRSRARPDSRRQRSRPRLRARRRAVRCRAQPVHHLGSPAAADERLVWHVVGEAGLGRSSGRRATIRLAAPADARAGHALQVQRRSRQPSRAMRTASVAPAAAASAARSDDGSDRRVEYVALVWLRQLMG